MLARSRSRPAVVAPLVAFAASIGLTSAASAAIRLKLTYNDEIVFHGHSVNTSSELDFVLRGRGVSVYAVDGNDQKLVADRASGSGFYYGPLRFRVQLNHNTIDLIATYKTHVTHTHVVSDGQSSCRASISSALRPGASKYTYEMPILGTVDVDETRLSNIRCELVRE